jgi:hypothetical protein
VSACRSASSVERHTLESVGSDLGHVFDVASLATSQDSAPYYAGSQGTQVSNYQPRQPAQAKVYSLTLGNIEADDNATNVVIGTIPLFGSVTCVLFDSGATHLFISSTFVKLYKLSTEPLDQNICVAIPVGDAVTCRKCVDRCPIVIEGRTLLVKLVVFSMMGFDVILGMDWPSKYKANIDCHKKKVTFRLQGIDEFKFCGSRVGATPPLVSAIQAIKNVRECTSIFALC